MIKFLLFPFGVLYRLLSQFNRYVTKPQKLYRPVISVGNITWGGSGKTPTVIAVAQYVLNSGKIPVILSRGYARKNKKTKNVIVRDCENILSDVSSSGDEPYMMACRLKCPIIVGSDRIKSAELAKKFNPDVFILDDGFQHWKIERDFDIVCINSLNPFGNGMIIPAGILREKKQALKRAHLTILTNCALADKKKLICLKREIFDITGAYPIEVSLTGHTLFNMFENRAADSTETLRKNTDFVVVTAIGSPDNFIKTVTDFGLKVKRKIIFADHHKYDVNDILKISETLKDNEKIVTTAKDGVKIKEVADKDIMKKIYVFNVSIKFDYGKELFEKNIKNLLGENDEKNI